MRVQAADHGGPSRGKNKGADADNIRFSLNCDENSLDYDSTGSGDFEEDEGQRTDVSDGNLQIHPVEEQVP